MATRPSASAEAFLPERLNLAALRRAAASCRGCELYRDATQTVFGEGPRAATVVLVGEQPGDREDLQGHPFVGPAGRLLRTALADAALERKQVYITNAVKHFKWEPRGKRRIHKKPGEREIAACRPWLQAELQVIEPQVVVCLGVTAMRAVFGRPVRLKDHRGSFSQTPLSPCTFVTVHPSSILRLRAAGSGRSDYEVEYRLFVADLQAVQRRLHP